MLLARLYDVANAAAYAEADSHCLCQNSKENDLYFSLKSYSFGTFLNVFHWATLYVNEANAPTSISPDFNDSATSIKSKMVFKTVNEDNIFEIYYKIYIFIII